MLDAEYDIDLMAGSFLFYSSLQFAPTLSIADAEATMGTNYLVQEIPSLKYWVEP
jgi:hypothetical protein